MLYGMADDRDETGYEMTEQDELSVFAMCERVGRALSPCDGSIGWQCEREVTCKCSGTGVEPNALNDLYRLVREVADFAGERAFEAGCVETGGDIEFTGWVMNGADN